MSPDSVDPDLPLRMAAFDHVRTLTRATGTITSAQLRDGFVYLGQRIPLVNPQRGIFKPRITRFLLSIRTVFPKSGSKVWYDDQKKVHQQIYDGDEAVDYSFMGKNPDSADNRWLKEAFENRIPVIYFLGVAPGRYEALIPAYIDGWNPAALEAQVVFGDQDRVEVAPPDSKDDRRYALREVKQRLHQSSFREAVLAAYEGRCAVSGLPESLLLDAAHIVDDRHEALGQPVITNGLPLSKLHHAAFDAHLIGIDPDGKIHVSERLLEKKDGPFLDAIKNLRGATIRTPRRDRDRPDRDRLALRFDRFREASGA